MDANFWHEMWASGVVGFHQQDINPFLRNHWSELQLNGNEKVLAPLCGKSLDMLWLIEQGHDVLGVELSQKALDEFLQENNLQNAEPVQHDSYCGYQLPQMELLCGDFFNLTAKQCAEIAVVYDRAALVALPAEMRKNYVSHLQKILPSGSKYFLVAMEYDQNLLQGPPFSVTEQEVQQLFAEFADISKVEDFQFKRKGVATTEKVYLMTLK